MGTTASKRARKKLASPIEQKSMILAEVHHDTSLNESKGYMTRSKARLARGLNSTANQYETPKRANEQGVTSAEMNRRSIFRVGGETQQDDEPDLPGRRTMGKKQTSTYFGVRDAAMHNLSSAELSKHDQSVPMGVIGLKNLGNTCFLNSSLQCLSATIPFTDYFLGFNYRSEINTDNFLGTGGKLVVAYAELMKKMWLGDKSVAEPKDFKQQIGTFAPQFNGRNQHDSQEFLSFLLDGIHEDLNRVKNRPYIEDKDCDGKNDEADAIEAWKNYLKRNRSLVVDLFQGQLKNTCRCLTCGHQNIRFETFMYLSLPIAKDSKSIEDCMDIYLEEETLKGADQWYCEKCKTHVDATKKTDLWILPPILIVHLKRFRYNDSGRVGSKNVSPIEYPIQQWDLKSRVKSQGTAYPMYDLYAVSNHVGALRRGHYTALALNRFDDSWYEFNDTRYRRVDESIHSKHSQSAYVLFYNRSEGDTSIPLSERAPLIPKQSIHRPDLWPHMQVEDPREVRDFKRTNARGSNSMDYGSPGSLIDSPVSKKRTSRDSVTDDGSSPTSSTERSSTSSKHRKSTKKKKKSGSPKKVRKSERTSQRKKKRRAKTEG